MVWAGLAWNQVKQELLPDCQGDSVKFEGSNITLLSHIYSNNEVLKRKQKSNLLRKIKRTPTGKIVINPTKTGKKRIKVTTLLKRRVNFALNVRK